MLLKQESLLEELAEGDQRWGSFEASIPESSTLTIIAQSVVEVVLIFTDHVILAGVFPGQIILLRYAFVSNVARRNKVSRGTNQGQTRSNHSKETDCSPAW